MPNLPLWLTRIEMDSMAPTLRHGQLLWTVRAQRARRLRRGAVVVADSKEIGRRLAKRIVGVPGNHVQLAGHRLWVDGELLNEPYATPCSFRGEFDVPADHFLLLGDDRGASSDSRSWRQPYVARSEIVGVVLLPRSRRPAPPSSRSGPWQGAFRRRLDHWVDFSRWDGSQGAPGRPSASTSEARSAGGGASEDGI